KNIEEWKSILHRYERIPNKEIQKILKVSFDALEEDEQGVFLDIACCFKGYDLREVKDILCAHHGQCIDYLIGVLVEKNLIKIIHLDSHATVTLHDLIEDMGKEIVRQESPKEPGKRSRLWFYEDIVKVFEENLRFLHLTKLNIDNSECLTQMFDVSGLQNLEEFSFRKCENLVTVHDSIGFLNKLKRLDAFGCSKLKSFPPLKLTSLEELELSYCKSLENFPEILGKMENLTDIFVVDTSIQELPFSFQNLTRLRKLRLWGRENHILQNNIPMKQKLLINASGCLSPKPNDKLSSRVSSNLQTLGLPKCNPSNEFLSLILTLVC
ncbi:hypothetical protein KIW84_013335, partial [Lathyrus oleraceus]